ncbi:hypothetical protein BKA93DRAFT_698523, partial [Sparassis latifolia]
LSVADQFIVLDGSDGEEDIPAPTCNPFQNVVVYGDEVLDAAGHTVIFSAGEDTTHIGVRDTLAQELRELEYYDHDTFGKMSRSTANSGLPLDSATQDDGGDSSIPDAIAALQLRGGLLEDDYDDMEEGDDELGAGSIEEEGDWAPHGSKTMFMLDLLDQLPRLRLSDDHLKAILWVMRE